MVQDESQDHTDHDAVEQAGEQGKHGVTRSRGQSVVHHEAGVEDLTQDLDTQVLQGDGHGGGIGIKNAQNLGSKELNKKNDDCRDPQGDPHGDVDGLAGPVELLGTDALGHHGGGRRVHGQGGHEGHVLDLGADAAGGRGLHPVAVDEEDHGQPGQAYHGHLDGSGDAQLDDLDQLFLVHFLLIEPKVQPKKLSVGEDIAETHQEGGHLGQNGGQGRTPDPPVKDTHEKDIQGNVAPGGDRHAVEGLLGVAHRPKHGRQGVVPKDEGQTHGADPQVNISRIQGGSLQSHQDGTPQDEQRHHGKTACCDGKGKEGPVGQDPVGVILTAKILAHEDVAAGGDAHDDLGENDHHLAGIVDGRNAILADEPPGDDQVRDGIGRLKQRRQQHRGCKDNKFFPNDAFRQVCLAHGLTPPSEFW